MIVALSIRIEDYATPVIAAKIASLQPKQWLPRAMESVKVFWRGRLKELPGNRKGWPSTGFWERAARSVTADMAGDNAATISADHQGLRQRWLGGPIAAVNAKFLTIPISSISYGKRAGEFGDALKLVVIPGKGCFLALASSETLGKTKDGRRTRRGKAEPIARERLQFIYKLVKSVDQVGNAAVVPTSEEIAEIALAEIDRRPA